PNYEAMVQALNPNQKKIDSHGIKSIRSRIGSIRPYLAEEYKDITLWEFTNFMICELLNIDHINEAKRYELTVEDWAAVEKIASEKYNNWDWNYGSFDQFEYNLSERFQIVTINIGLTIKQHKINKFIITGDFFVTKYDYEENNSLIGLRLKKDDLITALDTFKLKDYFGI